MMKPFGQIIHGMTIFEINGSLLFNVNFQMTKVSDENIMAGFLAGIVAFSQELGSEPTSIELSNVRYHVWRENQLIFALRTNRDTEVEQVLFLKSIIMSHPLHAQLEALSHDTIDSPEKKEPIIKILAEMIQDIFWSTDSKHMPLLNDQTSIQVLNDLFYRIFNKKAKPDYIAEKILATSLKRQDEAFIKQSKQWLQSILTNDKLQLDNEVKKILTKTLEYLDNEEFMKKRRFIFGPLVKKK